jgi:hypothetical protein
VNASLDVSDHGGKGLECLGTHALVRLLHKRICTLKVRFECSRTKKQKKKKKKKKRRKKEKKEIDGFE